MAKYMSEKLLFQKVYQVSKKADKPRLWYRHIVCEAATLKKGDPVYVKVDEEQQVIVLQNQPFQTNELPYCHVSSYENPHSKEERPLIDTAREEYNKILSIKEKVEVSVYRKGTLRQIIVQPLRFKMGEKAIINREDKQNDERLRLLSIAAGVGLGTSTMVSTGYFVPVQEIEYEEDSAHNLQVNFPNSFIFNGDLRDCGVVAKSDVAFVTLPCSEFSSLGNLTEDVFDNLILATADLLKAAEPRFILFENVPGFFKSQGYQLMKELLQDRWPYWGEKSIESYDFGAIARRNRTYAICTESEELFVNFQFPQPPKSVKRHKLKKYLDHASVQHEWKDLAKWKASFESREAWKDRSLEKTFVTEEARELNCLVKRYKSQCASNSYVLNKEGTHFRFLTINEIRRILGVPDWFELSPHIPLWRQYEMLGQSLDCNVVKALANRIAVSFAKAKLQSTKMVQHMKEKVQTAITVKENGQLELLF